MLMLLRNHCTLLEKTQMQRNGTTKAYTLNCCSKNGKILRMFCLSFSNQCYCLLLMLNIVILFLQSSNYPYILSLKMKNDMLLRMLLNLQIYKNNRNNHQRNTSMQIMNQASACQTNGADKYTSKVESRKQKYIFASRH